MENWIVESYNFIRFVLRQVPRGCRYRSLIVPFLDIDSNISASVAAIKRISNFRAGSGEQVSENSTAIHFVNKTPQRVRARFANWIFSIYPTISPLSAGSVCARQLIVRRNGMQLERECNYFLSDARRELVGRSLPALNAPEQRLSEVPLTRTRPIHSGASKCARKRESHKNLPTTSIYLSV